MMALVGQGEGTMQRLFKALRESWHSVSSFSPVASCAAPHTEATGTFFHVVDAVGTPPAACAAAFTAAAACARRINHMMQEAFLIWF
jgi:hypothetical protein